MKTLKKFIFEKVAFRLNALSENKEMNAKAEVCYQNGTVSPEWGNSRNRKGTKALGLRLADFFTTASRRMLAIIAIMLMGSASWSVAAAETPVPMIRIGLTATFPNDQYRVIEEWRLYLEKKLKSRVEFVRRDSYLEMMELLRLKKLEFAWICDYPFVHYGTRNRLLAVPLYQKQPHYRSYLIVSAKNSEIQSIEQLRDKMFAYTDPYSNTGYLTPRYQLRKIGEDPARFFRQTFFTWSHRKAIEAVAVGVADGAAVSNHVWETLAVVKPELTAATRVIWKSPAYGFAPFVAHASVPEDQFGALQAALFDMTTDEQGVALLRGLNLDGFIAGDPGLYDEVRRMIQVVDDK